MNIHRPSGCSYQKGDGNLGAMGSQLITALAAGHPVNLASAVELGTTLPKSEQRTFA